MNPSHRPSVAVLTAHRSAVAVAACTFQLADAQEESGLTLLQLVPAGEFRASDGRAMDVATWRIDAASAQLVIERFNALRKPLVIDYEHQTLHKEENGQPAPAAGWIRGLRWIEGRGLYAEADLTPRARAHIDADEYLYFSPVFEYARPDGTVLRILMGAFTNDPAIHGMDALNLAAVAAAHLPNQESQVNPLLKALLAALGLPETTTEAAATAALTAMGPLAALKARADAASTALGLTADATPDAVVAACSSLRTQAAATSPDPAKYVPVAVVDELKTGMAVLTAKQLERDINDLVQPALADGRLLPAQEAWARDLGKSNTAALTSYLATAHPIAALSSMQTAGRVALPQGGNGLTADELSVAAACGMTAEQFAKGKA